MADEDLIRTRPQPPAPTLRELAMVLFRQRKVFVCASGAVMAAAVLYVFAGPRYQANMKILVRPGRADAPVSAQENAPLDLTRLAITEEELNSEVELLHDDEVLRKVVIENGLGGRDWLHFLRFGEGREERIERAARQLAKKLKVEPVKKTNLIEIKYASEDATRAASVLHSLENAYLEKHTVVHRPNGEVHFFEQQTDDSRRQLQEAQSRLLQFTSAHRVIEAAQERDLTLTKLSDLDAGYRQTQIDLSETQQRVWELQERLKSLPERTTTQIRTADNPELLKALKSSLLDLQLKRTQLLTKFEPNHRLVQEVDQQIAQAQAAISGEGTAPVRDETTDKSAQYEWAKSELEKAQVELKGLQARAAATGVQESAYRALARQLGEAAITQDDLQNTEKAAEDNYLLYLKKREDARMADALDQRGIVNVAIAEQPAAPALPLWSTWAIVIVGAAAAGTAGTGAAFAADHLDPAFRNPEDVIEYLNAPVLASLPGNRRREGLLA
jgi:polysaccharide biosynthesis protein PslE